MTVVKAISELERLGVRLYLKDGVIRCRYKPGLDRRQALPYLEVIAKRQGEARAVLSLWGTPATPQEAERVKRAFSRPGTFIVYDERTGEMRWIC